MTGDTRTVRTVRMGAATPPCRPDTEWDTDRVHACHGMSWHVTARREWTESRQNRHTCGQPCGKTS